MIKKFVDNQIAILGIIITTGYLFYGYLAWVDGQHLRTIATIHSQPSKNANEGCVTHVTTKQEYKRGETVEAIVMIDKYRNIEGTVQWNLMDARFYPYAARRGVVPLGEHTLTVPIEKIPMHIPPGDYYFSGSVKYEPNPIADIYIPIRTNRFRVVE
jgi:hypothetical protein